MDDILPLPCCQRQRRCPATAFRMGLFDSILGGSDTADDEETRRRNAWKDEQMRVQQEILAKRRQGKGRIGKEDLREIERKRLEISRESERRANQYKDYSGDPLELWRQNQAKEAAETGRDVAMPFGYEDEPEGGIPFPANPIGMPTFDNGERFDLKLPYVDRGYEDESADVIGNVGKLFGGLFG
eukprot:CAMPEP_0172182016 /NCGR_PEP_ID=MMETSP1050-20130122/18157_1 /TAXON_ID=233186 /ORGANISM="Cryptomonas curvata, Strain CCAP979/52" /LENGTH=184 /DNA_ID=CAMNT_0012855399 /DNA_START=111 /DNA_END=661 /DNA_ORIENTATION=-